MLILSTISCNIAVVVVQMMTQHLEYWLVMYKSLSYGINSFFFFVL